MKIKLGQLVNAYQALSVLSEKEMNIQLAYKVANIIKLATDDIKYFEEERQKLVQTYGEVVEDGQEGEFRVAGDKLEEFHIKYNELSLIESVTDYPAISTSDFGDSMSISPKDILSLDCFISAEE